MCRFYIVISIYRTCNYYFSLQTQRNIVVTLDAKHNHNCLKIFNRLDICIPFYSACVERTFTYLWERSDEQRRCNNEQQVK